MIKRLQLSFLLILLILCGCTSKSSSIDSLNLASFEKMSNPSFRVDGDKVHRKILRLCAAEGTRSLRGQMLYHFYQNKENSLWLTSYGDWERIDTLVSRLEKSYEHALNPEKFLLSKIKRNLIKLRTLHFDKHDDINTVIAHLEYNLSSAYLKYVSGLSFGFVNPRYVLNRLDEEEPIPGIEVDSLAPKRMKTYYDVSLKRCDEAFLNRAFVAAKEDLSTFLDEVQPTDKFYLAMQNEYLRLNKEGDEGSFKDKLAVNMERMRWHPLQEKGSKYVVVNLATFTLRGINEEVDSVLEMKVCCGAFQNKTPLMASQIGYMQMNPYWTVPKSIIRKEIVPACIKDPTYLEKHRMKVYDKEGNEVNPLTVNWEQYRVDIPFSVKQEKGEGNSLGRLIFRFPNNFAIYLHDTSSRLAFAKSNRAVSHGCIRLERPLDFAFFLLSEQDEQLKDKIRIAIDLPPQTEEGKEILERTNYRPMKAYSFNQPIPLFLDYFTVYLSADGKLNYSDDPYQFDQPILKGLK